MIDENILEYRIQTIQENFERYPMKCNWCKDEFNADIPRTLHMIDEHKNEYTEALLG